MNQSDILNVNNVDMWIILYLLLQPRLSLVTGELRIEFLLHLQFFLLFPDFIRPSHTGIDDPQGEADNKDNIDKYNERDIRLPEDQLNVYLLNILC